MPVRGGQAITWIRMVVLLLVEVTLRCVYYVVLLYSTKVVLQYYSTAVCYGQRDAIPKLTA